MAGFEQLQMGPCRVTFAATDLGLTKGGVEVKMSTDVTDVTTDQTGGTSVDQVVKGRAVEVTVPLAERDLPTLAALTPGSTLVTRGAQSKLSINSGVGTSLRELANILVLRPTFATDDTYDFTVPLAMCKGDMSFAFKVDEQRIYSVTFTGFVDLDDGTLCVMGSTDPSSADSVFGNGTWNDNAIWDDQVMWKD